MKSEDLYHGCMNNDRDAWTYAYNFVVKYLKNKQAMPEEIQDAAQASLLYLINGGLTRIRNPEAFKSYLLRTAWTKYLGFVQNTYTDRRQFVEDLKPGGNKAGKSDNMGLENKDPFTPKALRYQDHDPVSRIETARLLALAQDLIDKMGQKCKAVLNTYFQAKVDGTPIKEVAPIFKITPNTFTKQVSRCMKDLMKKSGYQTLLKRFNQAMEKD